MRCLMLPLLLVSALALASCSASRVPLLPPSAPPVADLTVEPEPPLGVEALTSEAAYERWNDSIRAWGRKGWDQVARLCRWHGTRGAELSCPPPIDAAPLKQPR